MRTRLLLTLTACTLVVACDGGGTAEPATIAPTSAPPTLPPTLPATTTSTAPATTTTVPATLPGGVEGLSPGGPWHLVDSAPGITTPGLVYELMPKLWVYLPVEEDIDHGILWTFTPADRDIIEAYLQARLVFYKSVTAHPMDFESADWSRFYVDGGAALKKVFELHGASGEYADLGPGVVLRPEVTGDGRTETSATIFDCTLDGAVLRNADGSLAFGVPGVAPSGVVATLQASAEGWRLDRIDDEVDHVCR